MATICGTDAAYTLDELEADAAGIAAELTARGLGRGDRVLLKADNSIGYVTAVLALVHLGASIVLIDHRDSPAATCDVLSRAKVKACLVDDAAAAASVAPVPAILLPELAAAARPVPGGVDAGAWAALPDGLLMSSSGSTGRPKVVVKSGAVFLANLRRTADTLGYTRSDVLAPFLPFSHQYGLSIVLLAWLVRCSLVVVPYRRLDHALGLAGLRGATVLDAAPSTYRSMLNITRQRPVLRAALQRARMLCVGAAPLNHRLVAEYRAEFGKPLLDGYGSTELGNISFAVPGNPVATGRPVRGVHVRVVDDSDVAVAPGEVGELLVRTPDLPTGVLDDAGEVAPEPGGWFRTGDFGLLDGAGNLHVLGRKRAVHRMGYTLYPDMIEARVAEAGCCAKVVAVPDERHGSRLVAFVEDEAGHAPAYWRERMARILPPYEVPNRVVVVDSFPLNRNGKPDGRRLEELAATA
ncbi:acyl--CoA ligase [Amycolatopsis sp. NBC_00348]|uniref:class I adenylate-forming enzyme family protein n=1 Tax=Amycolatopsis sp. NBC_00348 TaxID=2975956 RepID=UPI002E266099